MDSHEELANDPLLDNGSGYNNYTNRSSALKTVAGFIAGTALIGLIIYKALKWYRHYSECLFVLPLLVLAHLISAACSWWCRPLWAVCFAADVLFGYWCGST